jgi:hypothetical protein
MRKQIFEPLGMNDTRADSLTEPIPDLATFYFPRFAADPRYGLHLMREIDLSCYAGSAAFLSTPSDLVRFAMAINSGKLLQPATVQSLQTSQRLASGQETGYGLGWDLETVALAGKQTGLVGHDGEMLGGMVASFMTFPAHGIVVAVASNISYADTYSVAVRMAQAFASAGRAAEREPTRAVRVPRCQAQPVLERRLRLPRPPELQKAVPEVLPGGDIGWMGHRDSLEDRAGLLEVLPGHEPRLIEEGKDGSSTRGARATGSTGRFGQVPWRRRVFPREPASGVSARSARCSARRRATSVSSCLASRTEM